MPKEQINWPQNLDFMVIGDNSGDPPASDPAVAPRYEKTLHVGWSTQTNDRCGHVQFSLRAPLEDWARFVDELRESKKRSDSGEGVQWEEGWMPEVYSGVLTRSEVNNLIKVLRRARDNAYGRDE